MHARTERPAFYARGRGLSGDLLALAHPPYTAWHLSYVAIGAAAAAHLYVGRLLWALAAFALAVGVAAHALDELHDRPLGTGIPDRALIALAAVGMLGAVAIGVAGAIEVTPLLAPFVVAGALFVPVYNLELLGGRAHSNAWFALGWGVFPALTGYVVESERITFAGVALAAGCLLISVAQRRLSTPARELRRRTRAVEGVRTRADGSAEPVTLSGLLAPLDGALAALSLAMVVLACGLVLARV
ncbi:MAG TPA: hypothetical protein VG053_08895 [Solirubrobacteraceae bacterium]|jgi:hypothetical protein|nr:hypothetical protein [Solirubrobacteraceae bacterium]